MVRPPVERPAPRTRRTETARAGLPAAGARRNDVPDVSNGPGRTGGGGMGMAGGAGRGRGRRLAPLPQAAGARAQ